MLSIALDKLSLGRVILQQAIAEAIQNNLLDSGSHAPAWEPVPVPLDAICIPTQVRGNEAWGNDDFKQALQTAKDWLNQAVDGLREAGVKDYTVRGLLARASYHRYGLAFDTQPDPASSDAVSLEQPLQDALLDLAEAHDIAQRGGMLLHLTDYHLESARLALTVNQSVHELSANQHVAKARQLIEETGYKRRLPELEYLEQQLAM